MLQGDIVNDEIKVWGWGELAIHHVWLELKYDPEDRGYHAMVSDADGVSGIADAYTPLEACAVAHYRQKQNRIAFDRRDE
jgi:hypothetical protein